MAEDKAWWEDGLGWDDVWGGAKAAGNALYEATPIDNAIKLGQAVSRGDWGEAGKQLAFGALDTALMLVPAAGAGRAALTTARMAGKTGFIPLAKAFVPAAAKAAVFGSPGKYVKWAPTSTFGKAAKLLTVGQGSTVNRAVGLGIGNALFGGSGSAAQAPGGIMYRPTADTMERYGSMAGEAARTGTGRYGTADTMERRQGVPGPAAQPQMQSQAAPAPRDSSSTFAAVAASLGSQLAALSPEMQAQLDEARSQALRDYQLVQAQSDLARRSGSMQTQESLREAGRFGAGSAADFRQIASELGFGSSPAAYGVGLDQIASQERAARAAAVAEFAALQEQLARQQGSSRNTYESILNRLDQEELQARSQQGLAQLMSSFGG